MSSTMHAAVAELVINKNMFCRISLVTRFVSNMTLLNSAELWDAAWKAYGRARYSANKTDCKSVPIRSATRIMMNEPATLMRFAASTSAAKASPKTISKRRTSDIPRCR